MAHFDMSTTRPARGASQISADATQNASAQVAMISLVASMTLCPWLMPSSTLRTESMSMPEPSSERIASPLRSTCPARSACAAAVLFSHSVVAIEAAKAPESVRRDRQEDERQPETEQHERHRHLPERHVGGRGLSATQTSFGDSDVRRSANASRIRASSCESPYDCHQLSVGHAPTGAASEYELA
jgi:hypothetical protein